jgi:DNA polymerase-4
LAQDVATRLEKLGREGRTVTLKVRYDDFTTITRSRTLSSMTREGAVIAAAARDLLHQGTEAGERPIRLIGVSVSGFPDGAEPVQLILPLDEGRG